MNSIKKFSIAILIPMTAHLFSSCKKNDTGGDAEIHAMIFHGSTPIIGTTTLYVKFDAKTQPSEPTSTYDLKVEGDPDDNHVHVDDLRTGDYYLYAVAFDSLAMIPVKGGVHVAIKYSDRKKMKEVEIQTN